MYKQVRSLTCSFSSANDVTAFLLFFLRVPKCGWLLLVGATFCPHVATFAYIGRPACFARSVAYCPCTFCIGPPPLPLDHRHAVARRQQEHPRTDGMEGFIVQQVADDEHQGNLRGGLSNKGEMSSFSCTTSNTVYRTCTWTTPVLIETTTTQKSNSKTNKNMLFCVEGRPRH